DVREEVSEMLENLMLLLLSANHFSNVAYILSESQVVVQRVAGITDEQRGRMGTLPDRLSAPQPFSQLLQGLDESADLPSQAELRQVAVASLGEIGSLGAMQSLERAVDDPDRDVRVAAVRALGARAHRGVLGRLEATVKAKSIRGADLTEMMAFFEAFGSMCG